MVSRIGIFLKATLTGKIVPQTLSGTQSVISLAVSNDLSGWLNMRDLKKGQQGL